MDKESKLRAIIDELKYENRKFEYSSLINKLIKRIDNLEERITDIENKI